MDTHDSLDLLLESSAPEPLPVTDDLIREMDRVADASRTQVAAHQPRIRRAPRLAAGVGLAVLLSGGAGAAVAGAGFDWLPWAQDPDSAYTFTLPSGRECEVRMVLDQTEPGGDWDGFVADVGQLTVDDATVEKWVREISSDPGVSLQVLNADGQWVDPQPGTKATEDDLYAAAHYAAHTDVINELSSERGIDGWWSSDAQMQCEAVAP